MKLGMNDHSDLSSNLARKSKSVWTRWISARYWCNFPVHFHQLQSFDFSDSYFASKCQTILRHCNKSFKTIKMHPPKTNKTTLDSLSNEEDILGTCRKHFDNTSNRHSHTIRNKRDAFERGKYHHCDRSHPSCQKLPCATKPGDLWELKLS